MATKIKHRRGLAATAQANNIVLESGERGFETDTKRWKTGDGITAWNDLEYDTLPDATESLAGVVIRATNAEVLAGSGTTKYASPEAIKNAIDSAIAALILNAPGALDTLEELALALGDDPNFATSISTLISLRVLIDDIRDNLISSDTNKPLSANQGVVLKALIDALDVRISALEAAVPPSPSGIIGMANNVLASDVTTEQIMYTLKVNHLLAAGEALTLDYLFRRGAGTGSLHNRIYLNTTPTVGGTLYYYRILSGQNSSQMWFEKIYFPTATSQIGVPQSSNPFGEAVPDFVTSSYDLANDLYVVATSQKTVAADVATLRNLSVKLYKKIV